MIFSKGLGKTSEQQLKGDQTMDIAGELTPLFFLAAAILALAFAPGIYHILVPFPGALKVVKVGCVLVVLGIVLLDVIPESFVASGWWVAPCIGFGLILPIFLERFFHEKAKDAHNFSLTIVVIGFAIHSLMDGVALAAPGGAEAMLSWAVVAHRVPDGLFVWCLLFPKYGYRKPLFALGTIGIATLFGFFLGILVMPSLESSSCIGLFEGFAGGALLHVMVGHQLMPHGHDHHSHSI
jgi:zinc transporter ZupT